MKSLSRWKMVRCPCRLRLSKILDGCLETMTFLLCEGAELSLLIPCKLVFFVYVLYVLAHGIYLSMLVEKIKMCTLFIRSDT